MSDWKLILAHHVQKGKQGPLMEVQYRGREVVVEGVQMSDDGHMLIVCGAPTVKWGFGITEEAKDFWRGSGWHDHCPD